MTNRESTQSVNDASVTIRPIAPEDRDALKAAFELLSPESRYRRFFVPLANLTDRDLDYLTKVDHRDHEALVAIDDSTQAIVGVARFVRTSADEAEPAIAVADDWQGRGLATRLLDMLATRAREESITAFRAQVLAHNEEAMAVLSRLGPTIRTSSGSEVELAIVLTPEPDARSRLLSVLRIAASESLAPVRTLFQRITWRPPQTPLDRRSLRNAIVVGTDGSDAAHATVLSAARLARSLRADLELVSVQRPTFEVRGSSGDELEVLAQEVREQGVRVEVHVRRSGPVASLVDVAAEQRASLIVVDASERTGSARLLAGDAPYAIARHASCDVLLMR
jgi:nucleotide-binding universal stress UspA family protein/RimJ/RimL family protein N-acetyltransferase